MTRISSIFGSHSKKLLVLLAALLFIPFLLGLLYGYYVLKTKRLENRRSAVNQTAGSKFPGLPLADTNGDPCALPQLSSENTIIDFWYRNCPACIAEMKQFEQLLRQKEGIVSIISISIDEPGTWKNTLKGNDERFSFLQDNLSNWKHLRLDCPGSSTPYQNNASCLSRQLGITGYPSFFVLDQQGVIKATPVSAVSYIDGLTKKSNGFILFLKSHQTWRSVYLYILLLSATAFYWMGCKKLLRIF